MNNNSYLTVMIQSLEKKIKILDEIIKKNQIQKDILSEDDLDETMFEKNIDEKAELIDKLLFLDQGFEDLYNRVKEELDSNKTTYNKEIESMKKLIQEISDKSVKVQAEEERNRKLATNKFAFEKKKLSEKKVSNRVANEYYRKMTNVDYTDTQLIDKKK